MKLYTLTTSLVLLGMMSVSALSETYLGGVSTHFTVEGKVTKKTFVDLWKLQTLAPATANVTYFAAGAVQSHQFTGALLWDLLQSVGIKLDSTIKNDILHKSIVVTGTDGYETVFSAGEINPSFGGSQIIIAYEEDGQSLGTDGFAKIIVPGDKAGGRFVSNIIEIKVISTDN
jgi:hypothetical protein